MSVRRPSPGFLLRLALLAAIVVVAAFTIDLRAVVEHFDGATWLALLAVQPIMLVNLALTAWRHAVLAKRPAAPFVPAFKAVVLAVGLNIALPGRLSELIKATYMRDHADVALSEGLAAVLIERLADLLIVAVMALAATGLMLDVDVRLVVAAILVVVVAFFVLATAEGLARRVIGLVPNARGRQFLDRLWERSSGHVREGRVFFAVGVAFLIWTTAAGVVWGVLAIGGSVPVGIGGVLAVLVATSVGGAVAALPAGLGTYEAAAVLVLRRFGYEFDEALALALALHASQFVLTLPLSGGVMLTERLGMANVIREAMGAVRGSAPDADAPGPDHS